MDLEIQKTFTFHVGGMHCASCEMIIESELGDLPYVTRVRSSLKNGLVEVEGNFGEMSAQAAAELLSKFVEKHGYILSPNFARKNKNWKEFKIALPTAALLVSAFIFLQKIGLLNIVDSQNIGYGTAFLIGVVASLSTCMAVVGGLILSMSATFAKGESGARPQFLFHLGRIVSFFILGGVIGTVGSAFTLNTSATFILDIIIGMVMLVLGVNLLDTFHWAKKLQLSSPKFIAKHAHGVSRFNHTLTPLLVGVATFFLPCGFTQSMQIYTLTTGSFVEGAFTMLFFALGTLPALALLSFSPVSFSKWGKRGIFFKTAGLVVIIFALFNLVNSLVIVGLIPPVFDF